MLYRTLLAAPLVAALTACRPSVEQQASHNLDVEQAKQAFTLQQAYKNGTLQAYSGSESLAVIEHMAQALVYSDTLTSDQASLFMDNLTECNKLYGYESPNYPALYQCTNE